MSTRVLEPSPPAAPEAARAPGASVVAHGLVLAGLAGTLLLVGRAPFTGDAGWASYVASRLLQGDRLYVDVAASEVHPPLYQAFVTALQWLASVLHVPGAWLLYAVVTLLAIASVGVSYRLAYRSPALLAALAFAAIAASGGYYAGGEQLLVIGVLAYLVTSAGAAEGARLRRAGAIGVGVAAGLGIALKPHFALLWLAVEAYLARRRGWRSFLRTESVTMVALWLVYIAATAVLTPHFFSIARWGADLYRDFFPAWTLLDMVRHPNGALLLGATAAALLLRPQGLRRHLSRLALVAAWAMWVVAIVQMKGWAYHWIPAQAFAILAVCAAMGPRMSTWSALPAALFAVGWMAMMEARLADTEQRYPTYRRAMAAAVRRVAPRGPILALTDQLLVGFPLVNDLGADWSSPFSCFWMAPGLSRSPEGIRYHTPAEWSPLERQLFDEHWRTIEARPPRVVILERTRPNGFDFRAFFSADPRLARLLSGFRAVERVGEFDVMAPVGPAR